MSLPIDAALHNPAYRREYRVDLLREFPRLPLYHDWDAWVRMGQELLDLHIGFECADDGCNRRDGETGRRREIPQRSGIETGIS